MIRKIKYRLLAYFIVLSTISNPHNLIGQDNHYYYVNTYELNSQDNYYDIYLKSIDLNDRSIQHIIRLGERGYISLKKPVLINIVGQKYLLSFSENGGFGKNSEMGLYTVYYSILLANDTLALIRSDSIPNATITILRQYPFEESFRFGLSSVVDHTQILPESEYSLNTNLNFRKLRGFDPSREPGGLRDIDGFEFLDRFTVPNLQNLFYSMRDSEYWILRLDSTANEILDSRILQMRESASIIFAFHPIRNKIYCFYLNFEQHGKFPEYEKNYGDHWITPEVLIYDPTTFELLETQEINDFTPENYPSVESGLADVVGDFIVYYFFDDEWMGKFYPAMLLIFDTRTNETTWLRVGWR